MRRFGQVFDQVAEAYDEVRPGYPAALVDRAVECGGLAPGSRVLEVGSGTGKLTELLVARGLRVDAVEPGPNMIAAARRRLGDAGEVTFHVGRFEDLDLPQHAFDGVFSATAFHWVDPDIGWAKAASHLKPGGLLALLAYIGVRDERSAALADDFLAILHKHAPDLAAEWRRPLELDAIVAGVEARRGNVSEVWDWLMRTGEHDLARPYAADLFRDVEVTTEERVIAETADELLAHYRTTSLYFRIAEERREAYEEDVRRLIDENGGTVGWTVADVLMTALAIEPPPE